MIVRAGRADSLVAVEAGEGEMPAGADVRYLALSPGSTTYSSAASTSSTGSAGRDGPRVPARDENHLADGLADRAALRALLPTGIRRVPAECDRADLAGRRAPRRTPATTRDGVT